jgi:hypothetical protein
VEHLALELVDALGGVPTIRCKHVGLDLLDVVVEARHHRQVVIHHPVDDRVQHRAGPAAQQVLALLHPRAHVADVRVRAVAHGDDEPVPREEHDLADLHRLGLLDVARGLQHHEHRALVDLELRPLVRLDRVLDG